MSNIFESLFKRELIPEALIAYRWRFPDSLNVHITESKDGGYVISVENLPGCITQAETGKEVFEMVNDAVNTYLEIPVAYRVHMPVFLPPEDQRKKFDITVPEEYIGTSMELVHS